MGGGEDRNGVGELAVLWAICAMEATAGNLKRGLWDALRKSLESAMQTDYPSSYGGFWPTDLRRFFRSTGRVLSEEQAEHIPILAELLRPYVRANETFFELIFALENGGVRREAIDEAVTRWDFTLNELATRYLAAETLRIEGGTLTRPWLDRVRALASERNAKTN